MATIEIKNVIIHEFIKEAKKPVDKSKMFNFRDSVLDPKNQNVSGLVSTITGLYGKKGNSAYYGIFKEDTTKRGPIPNKFEEYFVYGDKNTQNFIDFTVSITKQIAEEAEKEIWSSGGFLIYADYLSDATRYFIITMVKNKPGMRISSKLEPEELEQLDLSKIHQAARINFSRYEQYQNSAKVEKSDLNYLSFISKTPYTNAASYFITALGCDKGISSTKATQQLPYEIKKFFESHEELKPSSLNFRKKVIDYLGDKISNNQPAKLSDIEDMAKTHMTNIDDERKETLVSLLIERLNSDEVQIPSEFNVNKAAYEKMKNISYKSVGFGYTFEKGMLGINKSASVCYNQKEKSLTFTSLPESAQLDIIKALKEQGLIQ
ncbi:nucleoid-associated protein [Proteus mirabilis]|uniref:nucleoid-associated protein n=1 Tax=Proteus mirabilis TaxID=584 RepID=UPI001A2B3D7C|nr:nucleoid-associated protein [Proteus mirabilis]MBI6251370.1 nucleoid-associated protein [Proteus mirabilis]MBI6290686.1 nucleoid-associated protein [Proteus mirabilis]MDC5887409.1 nucleoid-associated protein [Proteus mirabilis]MDC5905006.1 nucleoid-associated protein [Proteus mirabilis]MDC5908550.1 nucleoid-associated protein [Proteus mirabilis]